MVDAATGVEFEVVLLDTQLTAEALDGGLGAEGIAEDGAENVGRGVVEAGEAALIEVGGKDALEAGSGGVEIADGRTTEGGSPGVRGAHGGGEVYDGAHLVRGVATELGNGGARAYGTPVAVRMNVVPGLGSAAETGLDFVADDYAFDEPLAVDCHLFCNGQGSRDGVDCRMSTPETVAFVHLQGDTGGGIG